MQISKSTQQELVTILDVVRWIVSYFNYSELYFGHGTDNSWDEAVSLVCQQIHLPQSLLNKQLFQAKLSSEEKAQIFELVESRVTQRKPLAYLTNQAWFAGLPFYVDERVLVPRSPFAELIAKAFKPWLVGSPANVLDLCTGSGCIAIALANAFPEAQVDAVDLSEDALAVADINIQEHLLEDRVFPIKSDLMSALSGQKYDLIVSNPPYVDSEDMYDLPDEFRHEPEMGLAAGDDGLDLVEGILQQAVEHLTDEGWLFVEVGNSQIHMQARFWGLRLDWVEFEHGGHGVFAVNRKELVEFWVTKAC